MFACARKAVGLYNLEIVIHVGDALPGVRALDLSTDDLGQACDIRGVVWSRIDEGGKKRHAQDDSLSGSNLRHYQ